VGNKPKQDNGLLGKGSFVKRRGGEGIDLPAGDRKGRLGGKARIGTKRLEQPRGKLNWSSTAVRHVWVECRKERKGRADGMHCKGECKLEEVAKL